MRRSRIRPVSTKRAAVLPDLDAAVEAAKERDGHTCQAIVRMPGVDCGGHLVGHHMIRRSQWRGGLCVVENIVTLCDAHHRAVHADTALSLRLGLLRYSWDRPGDAA